MEPTGTQNNHRPEEGLLLASRQDPRAARILARSLYKDMAANGLTHDQILAVTTELIGLVTHELSGDLDEDTQGTA